MRNTKLISISILPELLEKLDDLAREESRTRSELMREALRRYIADKEGERLRRLGSFLTRYVSQLSHDLNRHHQRLLPFMFR